MSLRVTSGRANNPNAAGAGQGTPVFFRTAFPMSMGALILAIGVWLGRMGWSEASTAFASAAWPAVTGQIESSQVQSHPSSGQHGGTTYSPSISYRYAVDGHEYTGTVIAPGHLWSARAASQTVRRFPPGARVPVHYLSTAPASSVLVPGLHFYSLGRLTGSIFFLIFGLNFLILPPLAIWEADPDPNGGVSFRSGTIGGKIILISILLLFADFFLPFLM